MAHVDANLEVTEDTADAGLQSTLQVGKSQTCDIDPPNLRNENIANAIHHQLLF